jgi:hypothetical protein
VWAYLDTGGGSGVRISKPIQEGGWWTTNQQNLSGEIPAWGNRGEYFPAGERVGLLSCYGQLNNESVYKTDTNNI